MVFMCCVKEHHVFRVTSLLLHISRQVADTSHMSADLHVG
jgi:hypothetical protein